MAQHIAQDLLAAQHGQHQDAHLDEALAHDHGAMHDEQAPAGMIHRHAQPEQQQQQPQQDNNMRCYRGVAEVFEALWKLQRPAASAEEIEQAKTLVAFVPDTLEANVSMDDEELKAKHASALQNSLRNNVIDIRRAVMKAEFPPQLELGLLRRACVSQLLLGEATDTPPEGITLPLFGETLDFLQLIILSGYDACCLATPIVCHALLGQHGITHIQLPSRTARALLPPMPMPKWLRHLLLSARNDVHGKDKDGVVLPLIDDGDRLQMRAMLMELVGVITVASPQDSAALLEVLKGEMDPAPAPTRDKITGELLPAPATHRSLQAAAWELAANIMGLPLNSDAAQEMMNQLARDDPVAARNERLRPTYLACPVTGIYLNRADAFIRACELHLPEKEALAAREKSEVHELDVHALTFPQRYPPPVIFETTAGATLFCSALVAGALAVRHLLLRGEK